LKTNLPLICVGKYQIQLGQWESAEEREQFLQQCKLGVIDLEDAENTGIDDYKILVTSDEGSFGITFSTSPYGIKPVIFVESTYLNLFVGFGQIVHVINIRDRRITNGFRLSAWVHQFRSLFDLGFSNLILVEGEIEIIGLNCEGNFLWRFDAPDVIERIEVADRRLILQIWDTIVPLYVNLMNGKPITQEHN